MQLPEQITCRQLSLSQETDPRELRVYVAEADLTQKILNLGVLREGLTFSLSGSGRWIVGLEMDRRAGDGSTGSLNGTKL